MYDPRKFIKNKINLDICTLVLLLIFCCWIHVHTTEKTCKIMSNCCVLHFFKYFFSSFVWFWLKSLRRRRPETQERKILKMQHDGSYWFISEIKCALVRGAGILCFNSSPPRRWCPISPHQPWDDSRRRPSPYLDDDGKLANLIKEFMISMMIMVCTHQ